MLSMITDANKKMAPQSPTRSKSDDAGTMSLNGLPPGPKTVFAHYMMCFHAFGNCTPGPDCSSQGASKYEFQYK